VIEHRRYRVPATRATAFEVAFLQAEAPLSASADCESVALLREREDASSYLIRLVWRDATAFEGSSAGRSMRAALAPFADCLERSVQLEPVHIHTGSCC
jgi:quinol monooxygenase YgiN